MLKLPARLYFVICGLLPTTFVVADENGMLRDIVARHCVECHSGDKPAAALNLEQLSVAFDGPKAALWTRVYDQTAKAKMPPPADSTMTPSERQKFAEELGGRLHAASLTRQQVEGRAGIRRLNRNEFENALSELLGVTVHVKHLLPEDATAAGFDTVASALEISPAHLTAYQRAVEAALAESVTTANPRKYHESFSGREWYERASQAGGKHVKRAAAVSGEKALLYRQTQQHWELNLMPQHAAKVPGIYRVRLTTAARNTGGKPLPVRFGWEWLMPTTDLKHIIDYRDVPPDQPAVIELLVDLPQRRSENKIGVTPYTLPSLKDEDDGTFDAAKEPALEIHRYEIEGPLGDWPSVGYRRLFGSLPLEPRSVALARAAGRTEPTVDWSNWRHEQFVADPLVPRSDDPRADAERLLADFLPRAFRRPVEPALLAYYVGFAIERLDRGVEFGEAMLAAYRAALCSPHFLLLAAGPGPLDDYALASRLSFFLWSSPPDESLLAVAAQGKLRRPDVLRTQVERMLDDPKAARFVENFCGQWLELRKVLAMKPDEQYAEYDDALGWSLARESLAFFAEVLRHDRSVTEFIESDWTFLNERLAQHYGVPDVVGMEFRRTSLRPEYGRGGVITHASILKVTANGTYTSPIKRGAWLLDRILGLPPDPPPPDVPAIEPDIRGATTLRSQIEKHRAITACAGCHAQIDPPGFALEAYDVIGGRRERYRSSNPPAGKGKLGPLANYPQLKHVWYVDPVETAAVTAAGEPFADLAEYKKLLLRNPEQIARNLVGKLTLYGTGAEVQFADRTEVERILAEGKFGLRSLIHAVVQSRMFLHQ